MEDKLQSTIKLNNEYETVENVFSGLRVMVNGGKTEANIRIDNIFELLEYLTERLFDEIALEYTNDAIEYKNYLLKKYRERYRYTTDSIIFNPSSEDKKSLLKNFENTLYIGKNNLEKDFENYRKINRNIYRRLHDFFDNCEKRYKEQMYFTDKMLEKVKKERVELEG